MSRAVRVPHALAHLQTWHYDAPCAQRGHFIR